MVTWMLRKVYMNWKTAKIGLKLLEHTETWKFWTLCKEIQKIRIGHPKILIFLVITRLSKMKKWSCGCSTLIFRKDTAITFIFRSHWEKLCRKLFLELLKRHFPQVSILKFSIANARVQKIQYYNQIVRENPIIA